MAKGKFTLKGVTKDIEVPVKFSYLPGKLSDRSNGSMKGDLLVIRSDFTIIRSDYKIKPGKNLDKVADEVDVKLAIAGAYQK